MEPTHQLQPGQILGIYRIVAKIGEGGMGEVYEAWEETLQRKVAIKILSQEALANAEMVDRFKGEGRALAKVRHPNVVALYTLGEVDGRSYMAMEFVDGLPASDFFDSHPCGLRTILDLFQQMAEGLACAHEAGVIHRDMKPQNIIVDKSMCCKLIDFGIAKVHSDHQTVQTAQDIVMGTANFLSPEVVMGRMSTPLSDIYSLGLVFYAILSGEVPFHGRSNLETLEKIRSSTLVFNPKINTILPEDMRQIIFRMTSKSPNMRYQNAREVVNELKKINLDSWPEDLLVPVFPRLRLLNRHEIFKKCELQGFAIPEIRLILNLAVHIEDGPATDDTSPVEIAPQMVISDAALNAAIQRYNAAKKQLITRRAEASRLAQVAPRAESRQKFMWPAISSLVIIAAMYFGRIAKEVPNSAPLQSARIDLASTGTAKTRMGPPKPQFRINDTYNLRVSFVDDIQMQEYSESWKVISVDGEKSGWTNAKGGRIEKDDELFLPPYLSLKVFNSADTKVTSVGPKQSLFPLMTGNVSLNKFRMVMTENGAVVEFTWYCKVEGQEQVLVEAGNFPGYKVTCSADHGPVLIDSFVYVPTIHHWVRRDLSLRQRAAHLHFELVGYELAQ